MNLNPDLKKKKKWGKKCLSQAAVQTEEGDPDGNPQKQGNQRGVDTPQQRAPTAAQGQPTCFL